MTTSTGMSPVLTTKKLDRPIGHHPERFGLEANLVDETTWNHPGVFKNVMTLHTLTESSSNTDRPPDSGDLIVLANEVDAARKLLPIVRIEMLQPLSDRDYDLSHFDCRDHDKNYLNFSAFLEG